MSGDGPPEEGNPLPPEALYLLVGEGGLEREKELGPEFSQGEESQEALAGEAEAFMGQTGSLGEKLEGEGECLVLGIW